MKKKGLVWGPIIKLILMLLVVGGVIIFLGKGTYSVVEILIDKGIIKQGSITESVEAESPKPGTLGQNVNADDLKYFNQFVEDIRTGMEECANSQSPGSGICRCGISVEKWPANPDTTFSASQGYLFRLQSTSNEKGFSKGMQVLGMKDAYDDYEGFLPAPEQYIGTEKINDESIVCTTNTFENFDKNKKNFGLKPEFLPKGQANFFRNEGKRELLELGVPDEWVDGTVKDSHYLVLTMSGIALIRFDKNNICFPTNRDEDDYGLGTAGGSITEYAGDLLKIPKCISNCVLTDCTKKSAVQCSESSCCKQTEDKKSCENDCDKVTSQECRQLGAECRQAPCCEEILNVGCRKKGDEKDSVKAFNNFVEDMKEGFTSSITKVPPKGEDICRIEITINNWKPNVDKGYVFRLYDDGPKMKASGFEGVATDYGEYDNENIIKDEVILEKSPYTVCTVSTMDDFDQTEPKFHGLKPEGWLKKLNFFRDKFTFLQIGVPSGWIEMDPSDSEYKAMVLGGKTQLIKFYEGKDTQNLCFVTDKEDPGYGIGTEGEPGDYGEYAKELFNIPLCIDEGEGT